jgi:hypothetical protein
MFLSLAPFHWLLADRAQGCPWGPVSDTEAASRCGMRQPHNEARTAPNLNVVTLNQPLALATAAMKCPSSQRYKPGTLCPLTVRYGGYTLWKISSVW